MANVMIRMDDEFKDELSSQAKALGLSLSAYIRSSMKEKSKKKELVIDRITREVEGDVRMNYADFKKEISAMIANAND